MDERIEAVRKDPVVGRGSCSAIDECMSDMELFQALNAAGAMTPMEAVKWARQDDLLYWERQADVCEDTACLDEYKAKLKAHPLEEGEEE